MICENTLDSAVMTTEVHLARAIMGKNIFGVKEVSVHYGVEFGKGLVEDLATVPFSEETLRDCKDTHLLVAGYPMTILDIRAKAPNLFHSHRDAWYNSQVFAADERVALRWHLLRKEIIAGSQSRSFVEQRSLLSNHEEVPGACELVYATILHFLATDDWLFKGVYSRCKNIGTGGNRIVMGVSAQGGLDISSKWEGFAYNEIGITSAHIPEEGVEKED